MAGGHRSRSPTVRFAEEAAARSEARYRKLVEHLPAVVYVDSPDIEPLSLYVSPSSSEILGYAPIDYLNDPSLWMRTIHPDDVGTGSARAWAATVRDGSAVRRGVPIRPTRRGGRCGCATLPADRGRGRRRRLLAGRDPRHHGTEGDRGRAQDVRVAVSGTRRERARHGLRVHGRAGVAHAVREPAPRPGLRHRPRTGRRRPAAMGGDRSTRATPIGPSNAWEEAVRTGASFDEEYRHIRSDGAVAWIHDVCRRVRRAGTASRGSGRA